MQVSLPSNGFVQTTSFVGDVFGVVVGGTGSVGRGVPGSGSGNTAA